MTETAATTNGTTPTPKADSALAKLIKASKDIKVNATDKKAVSAEFKKTVSKRAELQKALDDFDKGNDALAVKMIQCYGSEAIIVDGVRYVPTSRGERVYYKQMGGGGVEL